MNAVLKLVPNEKVCTKCNAVKPIGEFYRTQKGKVRSACKDCWQKDCRERSEKQKKLNPNPDSVRQREYLKKIRQNPETHRKLLERKDAWNRSDKYFDSYFKKKFGTSLAEVNSMLSIQGGRCANIGCGCEIVILPNEGQKKAVVDHCHATGRVRSMMCVRCNSLLGHVENSKTVVFGLFDYLNKYTVKGS